ncbi:MAG: hypothetical protein E6767_15000 [Dysgonomonas sp.]|nr:hypothetical protein [Dysgonomonas sp.]
MDNYRSIYYLKIEHGYFQENICRAISVTPLDLDLMKRRGILFRQTAVNEWDIICDSSKIGANILSEVFTFGISISDPAFILYTNWTEFNPSSSYRLKLPTTTTDAVAAIKQTQEKRMINSCFCTIELQFTENMLKEIQSGKFRTDILRFYPKAMWWEYFFIPRNGKENSGSNFVLKESDGKIIFSDPQAVEILGKKALRFLSDNKIAMKEYYDYRINLQEMIPDCTQVKKTLMKDIPHPKPGNFLNVQADVIQHICYF